MISRSLYIAILTFSRSVLLPSIVITGLLVGIRQIGILQSSELGAFDQMMRSRPDEGPDDRLLVVGITEEDIQTRKEYPIADGTLAEILQKIEANQPRAIGIDILRDVPQGTGREALITQLKNNDNIIPVCKLSSPDQPGISGAPGVPDERIGFADLPLDPGGTLRRSLLVAVPLAPKIPAPNQHLCNDATPSNQLPAFGFQLAMLYLQPLKIEPELQANGEIKISKAVFSRLGRNSGGYRNVEMGDYTLMLNYRSARNPAKLVSITEVLEGKLDPALVKDRVVLIGYTAGIVKDDFYTPYSGGQQDSQKMPGIVVHAQHVSQILSAVLNDRPLIWFWPEWGEILWIWGWSLVGGMVAWRIRQPLLFVAIGGGAIAILFGAGYALFLRSGWIPLVPPTLALVTTAASILLIDRGYAQAIYTGVKKMLKIEIDHSEREKAVSEALSNVNIDALKAERERFKSQLTPQTGSIFPQSSPAAQASDGIPDDYLQGLQDKAQQFKSRQTEIQPAATTLPANTRSASPEVTSSNEPDPFADLLQKSQQMRNRQAETKVEETTISRVETTETIQTSSETTSTTASIQITSEVSSTQNIDPFQYLQPQTTETKSASRSKAKPSVGSSAIKERDYFRQLQQQAKELKTRKGK